MIKDILQNNECFQGVVEVHPHQRNHRKSRAARSRSTGPQSGLYSHRVLFFGQYNLSTAFVYDDYEFSNFNAAKVWIK